MSIGVRVEGTNIRAWLEDIVEQEKQNLADDYRSAVVPRTPIDTGRARNGWQARKTGINNAVPYIRKLEEGYSRQAPRGFVQQALNITIERSNQRKY
jgi:hypothetical protein